MLAHIQEQLLSLFREVCQSLSVDRSTPDRVRSAKLTLEVFEDRWLPSGFTPTLVKDINPFGSIKAANITVVGSTVFFTATDALLGQELWRTDGTPTGTVLVRDIRPGVAPSVKTNAQNGNLANLVNVNGTLFFQANDGSTGYELWRSDGTSAGTVLVKDIRLGTASSTPSNLVNVNGTLFFQANDGSSGYELWTSDGTSTGTILLQDINAGSNGSAPTNFVTANGTVFFQTNDGSNGVELWKSNGTSTGTVLVRDIRSGSLGSTPTNLTNVNGTLFFAANDGSTGVELWKSDGTSTGTVLVRNINAGSASSTPRYLTNVNGTLFFSACGGATGNELWKSDGTSSGTVLVKDIASGGFQSNPSNFVNVGGTLFFTATEVNATGREVWKSNGTSAGTVVVRDIRPGSTDASPTGLTNVNGTLFFAANDGSTGAELWRSDGTSSGTALVREIFAGSTGANVRYLTNVGGTVFFSATDGTDGTTSSNAQVWASDGTSAGTRLASLISIHDSPGNPKLLANVNGTVYFAANDGTTNVELWKSDGTSSGTVLVRDINPGAGAGNPQLLTNINGILYFKADDASGVGQELWKSDGTSSGTVLVRDINPGSASSNISNLTEVNGVLYFQAGNATSGLELWKSDGTSSGTALVSDIRPGSAGSVPTILTNVNGTLFFRANDGSSGYELWKSDGTSSGTVLVRDLNSGSASGNPTYLVNYKGSLFFRAQDGSSGYELWKSDGTSSGTVLVKDMNPGSASGAPKYLVNVNGTLFFRAQDGSSGYELWKSDGTSSGTVLVSDVRPGSGGSAINTLTEVGGVVYFQANSGSASGYELWKSDGTSSGTVLVKDILNGGASANPKYLTNANGKLFFQANDGSNGAELWQTDGTSSGTVLAKDIFEGSGTSSPKYLTNVNGTLFFRACDLAYGLELWKVDVSSVAPSVPDLAPASDSGSSNTDDLTNDTTPTFTGTAGIGVTVELYEGTTLLGSTTTDAFGTWSITSSPLAEGVHAIFARTTIAGNSADSAPLNVTIDTTSSVSVPDLDAPSDTGTSQTDNLTSDTTPTLSGTAEAGSAVELYEGTTLLGTATADGSGNWSVNTSVLAGGTHNLFARATDLAGNTADSGALTITLDTTPPAVSVPDLTAGSDTGASNSDNLTRTTTPTFTGTAEAGSVIELYEGTTLLGTATATGGTWSITSAALAEGAHNVFARATDAAGNTADSAALTVTIDTTPPAVSAPDLSAGSDTGSSNADNLTKDTTPTLSGTAEVNSVIQLYEGTTLLGTAAADGSGNWSVGATFVGDGAHAVFARATDPAGNSIDSGALTVTIDTTPPAVSAPDLDAPSDTGFSPTDNLTNDTTPTLSGTAEANSAIELYEGTTLLGTATADGSGNWSVNTSVLAGGTHNLFARATDLAGNTADSGTLTITLDTTPPAVSVPDLTVGSDTGASNSDNLTRTTTPTFTGTAEAGRTVQLYEGTTLLGSATADGSGNWAITSTALSDGAHAVFARATDAAGNTADSAALTVTIDTAPPTVSTPDLASGSDSGTSTDNLTNDTTPTFTGTTEANSTVDLYEGTTKLGTTTADGSGNWSITTGPLANGGHTILARATDAAGNVANSGTLTVTIDSTPPAVSDPDLLAADDSGDDTDNFTTVTTPRFTGTAEPNSTVELYEGATLRGTITADGSGNWEITSTALSAGEHQLFARATDAAGNVANSGSLVVTIITPPEVSLPDLLAADDTGTSSTDNLTKLTTLTFTGTATAGSTVDLFEGTTKLNTVTATAGVDGKWTVTTGVLSGGAHTVFARATLFVVSSDSLALGVFIDTSGPTVSSPDLSAASDSGTSSVDNVTRDTTPTITGTAEAGATVTLLEGATTLGTTTADGSGNWSITTGTLLDGSHTMSARATDAAGNETNSGGLTFTIDTTPPAVSAPDLTAASDLGASNTDDVTNVTTPTLTGTAEPGSTVELYEGTTLLGTATADGSGGNWSITTGVLTAGAHLVFVRAIDVAGNQNDSGPLTITIDTTPPAVSTPDLASGSDSGTSNTDNLTSDTTPTFTGTAEANSTVDLYEGATLLGTTTADGSGNWSVTASTLGDGAHTIFARATDLAGNSTDSGTLTVTIDTTPPVTSAPDLNDASDSGVSNTDNRTNVTTPTFTGTAEAGTAVTIFDGATPLGTVTADGSGNWIFTTGVLSDGIHSVAARATDAAGNQGAASAAVVVTIDTQRPTVTATVSDTALRIGETATVTFAFSEAVTGFTTADLTAPNGAFTGLSSSDGGVTWTGTFTPTANVTAATNFITVDMTGVTDLAGNAGTGTADSNNYAIDTQGPTAMATVSDTALRIGETATVTFAFSEAVTGFTTADLTAPNGAFTGLSSSDGVTWTATFTPNASVTDATNVIAVDLTGVTDLAGNAGTSTANSNNYAIDTQRPTPTITSTAPAVTTTSPISVTVTFDEAVTGFTAAGVTVGNGTVTNFAGSGTTYTFEVVPTGQGTVTVDMGSGVGQDAAGNGNSAATQLTRTYDSVAPTATITSTAPAVTRTNLIPVTVTFTESVTGFTEGDVIVGNGTVTNFAGSGTTYTFDVIPTGQGAVTVDVGAGAGQDAAGNGNSAAIQLTRIYDSVAPTATITSTAPAGTNPIPVTVTFSESVTGFTVADVVVVNGTVTNFAGSGTTYTFEVIPTGQGTLTVDVGAGAGQDAAGNGNTAATQLTRTFDTTRPTITISPPSVTSVRTGGVVTYTITYADANFNASTLTAANIRLNRTGTANGTIVVTGTGRTRTVTIRNITGIGTLSISIAAGTATDKAGNKAPAVGPSKAFSVLLLALANRPT